MVALLQSSSCGSTALLTCGVAAGLISGARIAVSVLGVVSVGALMYHMCALWAGAASLSKLFVSGVAQAESECFCSVCSTGLKGFQHC